MVALKPATTVKTDPPKTDGKKEEKPKEVFTYEGPSISFGASIGTSRTMKILGFQATTAINHKQSIAFASSVDVSGPGALDVSIKGGRKTLKMNLACSADINPGALYHKAKKRLSARGVDGDQSGGEKKDNSGEVGAKVSEVKSVGSKNSNGPKITSNFTEVR